MACLQTAAAHPIQKYLNDGAFLLQASAQVAADSWTPQCLDPSQNGTLILLAERIVPNSSKAQTNRFIDLLLSVDTAETRKKFTDSLSAFDRESLQRFGRPFKTLPEIQQNKLLTVFSAPPPSHKNKERDSSSSISSSGKRPKETHIALFDHFENLKSWITGAYYSSEVGMRELGWSGDFMFDSFSGCQHPEGHS